MRGLSRPSLSLRLYKLCDTDNKFYEFGVDEYLGKKKKKKKKKKNVDENGKISETDSTLKGARIVSSFTLRRSTLCKNSI